MAKIPKSNERYRTKDEIVTDVVVILKANLTYGTRYAVLADIAWVWSEFDGKYRGCRYWSKKSLKMNGDNKMLCHEHIVPKRVIIEKICSLKSPTKRKIFDILQHFCIGCVVTREEDKKLNHAGLRSKMPDDWDDKNPWARYDRVKIQVVDTHEKKHLHIDA